MTKPYPLENWCMTDEGLWKAEQTQEGIEVKVIKNLPNIDDFDIVVKNSKREVYKHVLKGIVVYDSSIVNGCKSAF